MGRSATGASAATLSLVVQANPRQASRAPRHGGAHHRDLPVLRVARSARLPYPSFTVALSESDLPGGHSPAYFAILNQPLPTSPFVWRNDPVSFDSYPTFFLAHELAHQWWGQAVGWKNYHEQWLSEGFAQYFAAHVRGEGERRRRRSRTCCGRCAAGRSTASPQGPVYLGYRLGHIKSDSRVFRAVIYNKAAMVLHMLRQLVGDEAFFRGHADVLCGVAVQEGGHRRLPVAMEKASGQDLSAFFEAWIYRTAIPRLQVRHSAGLDRDGHHRAARRGHPGAGHRHAGLHQRQHRAWLTHPARRKRTADPHPAPERNAARAGGEPGTVAGAAVVGERVDSARRPLRQVDRRARGFAVPFERLEHQDEAGAGVLVEPRQPFAQAAAIDFLPADLGRTAECRGHGRHARADLTSLPSRNGSTGTDTARGGNRGRDAGGERPRERRGAPAAAPRAAGSAHDQGANAEPATTGTPRQSTTPDRREPERWRERSASIGPPLLGEVGRGARPTLDRTAAIAKTGVAPSPDRLLRRYPL